MCYTLNPLLPSTLLGFLGYNVKKKMIADRLTPNEYFLLLF